MSKWDIEVTLSKVQNETVEKKLVCEGCPNEKLDCPYWSNCSRAYILGCRAHKDNLNTL